MTSLSSSGELPDVTLRPMVVYDSSDVIVQVFFAIFLSHPVLSRPVF